MMEFKYTFDDGDYNNNPTTTSTTSTSKKARTSTIDNSGQQQQQQQQQQQRRRDDTNTVMNEYELTNINQKWRNFIFQFLIFHSLGTNLSPSFLQYHSINNSD